MQGACRRAVARCLSTSTNVPAAAGSSAVATSSAVKLPVVSAEEQRNRGHSITDPTVRYNIKDTANVDLKEVRTTAVLSDTKDDVEGRTFMIYQPGRSAMTSGTANDSHWAIRANNVNKWSNQLMGWISSADSLQTPMSVNKFETVEQAILFCERNGLKYEVRPAYEHHTIATHPHGSGNQYSYNILPLAVQTEMKNAGTRRGRHWFANPDSGSKTGVSTWINLRHTQYGPDPWVPRKDIKQGTSAWTGKDWAPPKKADGAH